MPSRHQVRRKVLKELVAAFDHDELDTLADELKAWVRDARELTNAVLASDNASLASEE